MADAIQARQFLDAAFSGAPENLYVLLWTLSDKRSRWYRTDQIERIVGDLDALDGQDVYVGVSLSAEDRGAGKRYQSDETAGIVGLWLDIDVASEEHRRENLPPTDDAALGLLASLGPEPSVVVHSGHGLQAWWLFAEPLLYASDADRIAAGLLATRWNLTARVRAAERGWHIDATQDLARILRLPGTTNHKGAPVPVRLLSITGARYDPSDLEAYFADDQALGMLSGRRTYTPGDLALSAEASPPLGLYEALRDNDAKFASSCDRTRKDLVDQSASSYDLSLATLAALAGWADQQIVDLLVYTRRKHGDDLKLRRDYYVRTLSRARDALARQQALDEIETTTERVERADVLGDVAGELRARRDLLDQVSLALGITIVRMIKYLSDPPRYRIETTVGAVTLGGAAAIIEYRTFRSAVAGATDLLIPRFKGAEWDSLAQAIFSACEREDTGIEATDEGLAYAWLVDYLADRSIVDDLDQAIASHHPFARNGSGDVCIFGPSLRRWLWTSRGDRVSPQRMGEVLRTFGAEHERMNLLVDGERTTRSVWVVPWARAEHAGGDR